MGRSRPWSRHWRQMSMPFPSGSHTSRIAAAARPSRSARSQPWARAREMTSKPSSSRAAATAARVSASSSRRKTRVRSLSAMAPLGRARARADGSSNTCGTRASRESDRLRAGSSPLRRRRPCSKAQARGGSAPPPDGYLEGSGWRRVLGIMNPRARSSLGSAILVALAVATTLGAQVDAPSKEKWTGPEGGGTTLLPNGWRIAPAGRHLTVGDLPLAMIESPDGRNVIVSSNGWSKPTFTMVDVPNFYVRSKLTVDHAWLGLAAHPDGRRLYSSGAGDNSVREYKADGERLVLERTFVLTRPARESFVGGLSLTPDGTRLFAVHVLGDLLSVVNLASGPVMETIPLSAEGYTTLVSHDGRTLFLSLWGGAKVLLFDTATLESRVGVL